MKNTNLNERLESIVLDDGIEYLIYETETIDNTEYTLFININDSKDICFRKTIIENDEKFYIGLKDKNEFDKVVIAFSKKILK